MKKTRSRIVMGKRSEKVSKISAMARAKKIKVNFRRGADHPFSKLSNAQRRWVIKAYDTGKMNQPQIARKFDVTQACISHIVRNQRWLLEWKAA